MITPEDILTLQKEKDGAFWRIIRAEIERRIQKLTDDVMDELIDPEEEKRKKYKATAYKVLLDIPDILIRENEAQPIEKKADPTDPY